MSILPHATPAPAEALLPPVLEALRLHMLMLQLDPRGRIVDINDGFCTLSGWPVGELLGAPYRKLTRTPMPGGTRRALRSGLDNQGSWRGVLPLRTREGAWRWMDLVVVRTPDGYAAFGADVTQAHRQEDQLAKLSRLYEALGQVGQLLGRGNRRQALFDGVCEIMVTVAGFKMVWIGLDNPVTHEVAVAAQYGDTEGYLKTIRVRSDDTPEGRGPGGLAIRTGRPCVKNDFLGDPGTQPWHLAALRAGISANATFPIFHGNRVIGHLSLYSGERDFFNDAEVGLMEKVATQLSFALHHLEQEAERARAEERFLAIFNASPAATALSRVSDGTFVEVNTAFERILEYPAGEVLGRTGEALGLWVEPDTRAWFLENLRRSSGPHEWVATLRTRSGREIQALFTGEILDIHGERFALSLFLDVTQARQIESERDRLRNELYQSQKMEAIGLLAGGVAHDLNNVLAAILAHAEIMEHKLPPDSPLLHHVQQTQKAVDRSHGIVRQLLAFSRKLPTRPILLDLNDQITQLLRTLAPLIGEQIHLDWVGAPDLPKVTCDPHLLDQVVMNLLVNARDAMPKGGTIYLSTRTITPMEAAAVPALKGRGQLHVCLACRDTGHGMDEATKARIFDPFFTTKGPEKGTGLGLSTVIGIIDQAGGGIEVDSAPGEGAEFRIYLPAEVGAVPEVPPEPRFTTPIPSLRILLVEDNAVFRTALAEGLRMHGQQVLAVDSPLKALGHLEGGAQAFDVLISDVVLPGMSGVDLVHKLHQLHPGMRVILISGYSPEALDPEFQLDSRIQFLPKPFTSAALLRLLETAAAARPG